MSLYNNTAARLDTIVGGEQTHLRQLISAREEFSSLYEKEYIQWERFYAWLIDVYGIRMTMTEGGMVNLEYEIVDEVKYLIFTLKHSGK